MKQVSLYDVCVSDCRDAMIYSAIYVRIFLMVFLAFSTTLALSASSTKTQASGLQYQVANSPPWVIKDHSGNSPMELQQGSGSTQILLSDTQVSLLGPKPVTYVHVKNTARERSGLESISTLQISFNPSYQTLTLHDLAVIRQGKRMDRLKTARIDLAQRERHLEEGVYDEAREVIVALEDVRVGDIVEYAYSVTGENPALAAKYSRIFSLNREQPVARLAVRIQYPASRKLRYKLQQSDLSVVEASERGISTLSLYAEALPAFRIEQEVPSWFVMFPWLQVTEYESWEDVGVWAKTLYAVPADLNPAIGTVIDDIAAESKLPREQASKALAWVQNEIRYYSVAVGTSSHRPNHPNVTVRQRFGDCKDKAVLLSAMLRRLGIKAEPALVSYLFRKGVAEWLPTHQVFDHVIVQAQIEGETFWLDPTLTYQGTTIENLGFFPFGKALLAESAIRDFVAVAPPTQASTGTHVSEKFKITRYGLPATLEVEQKFFGTYAEWFRRKAAADGIKRFVEAQQAEYAKDFPNITLSNDTQLDDNKISNVVSVTQTFRVPQLFNYEGGRVKMLSTYARSIVPWLRFPGTPDRKFPLSLPFPGSFQHTIIVELPHKLPAQIPPPETWQDRHLILNNRITLDGSRISVNYSLRTLQDHVATVDYPTFSEKLKQGSGVLFSNLSPIVIDNSQLRSRLSSDIEKSKINVQKPDQMDKLYQSFLRDFAIADEAIKSELLAGTLLAKAYKDRAQAGSLLGRRAEALIDVSKAIELDADEAFFLLKAEAQLYSGLFRDAIETLSSVITEGNRKDKFTTSGMANYYLGNFEEAATNFAKAAELANSEELPYSLIWSTVAEKRAGRSAGNVIANHRTRLARTWPAEAIGFLLGESTEETLIAAAKRDDDPRRLRLCEAYFYLGQKALLDGKHKDARDWFEKSVNTKAVMYREHIFSQMEIKRLSGI